MIVRKVYRGLWLDSEATWLSALLYNYLMTGCHQWTRHPVRYGSRRRA